jgi:hypothetical protein
MTFAALGPNSLRASHLLLAMIVRAAALSLPAAPF